MINIVFIGGVTILVAGFILFTAALGGILYQHIVEFRQPFSTLPQPQVFGRFFKFLMPAASGGLVLATLLLWNTGGVTRLWLIASITGMLCVSVFTNRYFVPIHVGISDKQTTVPAKDLLIKKWRKANYYRMALMLLTIICWLLAYSMLLLDKKG